MRISSPAFSEGAAIPREHTCDGSNTSPPLAFSRVPKEAATLALIAEDPDAPRDPPFIHWLIWNLPATTHELPAGYPPSGKAEPVEGAKQGRNDFDKVCYGGPCPPKGHGVHHYRFLAFSVNGTLDLDQGASKDELRKALQGRVIASATLTGTYGRS